MIMIISNENKHNIKNNRSSSNNNSSNNRKSNTNNTPTTTTDDVHYNSTGLPPVVNITNPSHTNMEVHWSLFYLKARAYNVNSKSQIVINNNGDVVSSSDYSFYKNSSLIFYKLELSRGLNVIEISAPATPHNAALIPNVAA